MGVGAAIGGTAVLGGGLGYLGARESSQAQQAGLEAQIAELRRQYDLSRADIAPYRAAGQAGLSQMLGLLGIQAGFDPRTGNVLQRVPTKQIGPGSPLGLSGAYVPGGAGPTMMPGTLDYQTAGAGGPPDMGLPGGFAPGGGAPTMMPGTLDYQTAGAGSPPGLSGGLGAAITDVSQAGVSQAGVSPGQVAPTILGGGFDPSIITRTPGYQFRLQQGQQALERSAAARGRALSGQQLQALSGYGQGMAAQEFGDYFNRLAALSGVGQTATQGLGGIGSQLASGIGGAYGNIGAAQGQGISGQYGALGGALGGGLSNWLFARQAGIIPRG
jgi:hypothetical protein